MEGFIGSQHQLFLFPNSSISASLRRMTGEVGDAIPVESDGFLRRTLLQEP
jgi:hypothetical protein